MPIATNTTTVLNEMLLLDVAKRCHLIVERTTEEFCRFHVLLDGWQCLQNSRHHLLKVHISAYPNFTHPAEDQKGNHWRLLKQEFYRSDSLSDVQWGTQALGPKAFIIMRCIVFHVLWIIKQLWPGTGRQKHTTWCGGLMQWLASLLASTKLINIELG